MSDVRPPIYVGIPRVAATVPRPALLDYGRGGCGDAIFEARWLPRLTAVLPDLTVVTHPALTRLFSLLGPRIVGPGDVDPAAFEEQRDTLGELWCRAQGIDFWSAEGSKLLLERWWQPPFPTPLWADERLPLEEAAGRRIGLCCHRSHLDVRSVRPREVLDGLREVPDVSYVSLNLEDGAELGLPGLASRGVRDFADTAGLVRQLDLVITQDCSVAHLAAALGIPTWVLAPPRWVVPLDDMYPGVARMYRSGPLGVDPREPPDWTAAVAAVRDALEAGAP